MGAGLDAVGVGNINERYAKGGRKMKIFMIGPIEKAGGVATHTKAITNELLREGIGVKIYNISSSKDYLKTINLLIKIYKRTIGISIELIKSASKLDVVHVQSSGPLGGFLPAIVASFWKKILKFRLVTTFHYSKTEEFIKKYPKVLLYVLSTTDKFIVVSNKQKDLISSVLNQVPDNKLVVIPNGYDCNTLKAISKKMPREKLSIDPDSKVLVNVALLREKKGQKYLIDAMDIIVNQKNMSNVLCFIVGKGPLYNTLQKQVESLNLSKNIYLTGYVSPEKLSLLLNSADLFVLPSLNEGNPTVMFEALGVGLPFVGTKVGGIPEIITSEDYGLLVEPANPQDLAEKILIALDKEWNREKILKYAEQFTWKNIAKEMVEIYEKVLMQ